jgi:hypothetical protein
MIEASPNRRSFVRKLGLASAAAGAIAMGDRKAFAQVTPSDVDVLNFALNLEYLEAEFYTVATGGQSLSAQGLTVTGSGNQGAVTGGKSILFTDTTTQAVARELAADEQAHVTLLQQAITGLGGQPIAEPAINLNALGIGFGSQAEFLTLARGFEDLGVTAYAGAAPLISSKTILGDASRILAVEAYHAGNIRFLIAQQKISVTGLDAADHLPPPAGNQYFPTDSNGLVETRTPGQVLYVTYGYQANATKGGFFPSGVNGNLNTSASTGANTDAASITAAPNPIPVSGNALGVTTISWNAPGSTLIEIRVGSPNGPLFTYNVGSGSMTTGAWVTDGMVFYLQDVSNGKLLTAQNTLATTLVHLKSS